MNTENQVAEIQNGPTGGHLAITGLEKLYQSQKVVADLDLEVHAGEFIALLGPSGCGKTTVLRSIAGLVDPSGGDIRVDDVSVLRQPVHKRDFGMVFQSYALFPHLRVWENVAFGLKMRGTPRNETVARSKEALSLVQMSDFSDRYPTQLSGGQQQRVALARAIVTGPKVLLLDEPFSALDAKLRESMQIELRQLQKRLRITTIFVTHDQHEAMTMADRIAVMSNGHIEQFDTPKVIYDRPSTLFVAEFIGKANRMPGLVMGKENEFALIQLDGHEKPCRARNNPEVNIGDRVLAIVRPEKIALVPQGEKVNGYTGLVSGRVSEVIFTGEKSVVFLDSSCGNFSVIAQNDQHRVSRRAEPGCDFQLGWNASDMLVFPLKE